MAFWGIEVKPAKPYIHRHDDEKGRLHISQATLGTGSSNKKSVVQYNVGDKKPVYLCSLLPERLETCALNLEFDGEVTFSVLGSQSVHLSGFFYGEAEDHDHPCDDCDYDPYEDGVMMTEDESVYDSEDEYIGKVRQLTEMVLEMGKQIELMGSQIQRLSQTQALDNCIGHSDQASCCSGCTDVGVEIEEIVDEEKPTNENGVSKCAKKKKSQLSTSEDNENSINDEKVGEIIEKKIEKDDVTHGKNLKRKIDGVGQDVEPSRKKKKKLDKQQEIATTPNREEKRVDKKGYEVEKQNKTKAKTLQVRTFSNGLVIEELVMGKPNGKRASKGKKVSVHYIGKLKKNGKIFDSNIGKAPFKFRLGIGQVIKGWDVGVNGMHVGDKRRLTIPPAMGYGAKGAGPAIPPNSWLVFDVELIGVN